MSRRYRNTLRAHAEALAALGRAYAELAKKHRIAADAVAREKRRLSAESDFNDWLFQTCELAAASERLLALEVELARHHGVTWTEISDILGVTRQAAWDRFSKHERWNKTKQISQLNRARRAAWLQELRRRVGDDELIALQLMKEQENISAQSP